MNEVIDIYPDWIKRYHSELYHYGIKGMRWGVRRTREQLDKTIGRATMNLQLFAKRARTLKTVKLDVIEYAHVMSELRTHITDEEKKHSIISRPIGNFIYRFENHFNDTYRVVGKKKIPKGVTRLFERDPYA